MSDTVNTPSLIDALLDSLDDGPVREVRVGAHWTAVVIHSAGMVRCGLASTLREQHPHHTSGPSVRDAGQLVQRSGLELAQLVRSERSMEVAIGMAAINALLPPAPEAWVDGNAEEVLARDGAGKRVALVGHFPFVASLRQRVATLWVLELQPQGDDLPAEAAAEVVPQADVLAISGTTLMNHTFSDLLALRRPDARVMVLGPSTPLSPILFEYGVTFLSGSVVINVDAVLRAVSQGANFRQLHAAGVRLVTMQQP